MIIPLLGLLAVFSPVLTGGRLRLLGDVQIRHGWLVLVALAAQVLVIEVVGDANHGLLAAAHVATYALAGWFVWLNRHVPGLWIVALGAACNGLTIAANGGTLPASRSALASSGLHPQPDQFENSGVLAHPRLAFLGDVFAIPKALPLSNVFSVGDVLIVIGIGWAAHRICGSRLVRPWQPDTDRAEENTDPRRRTAAAEGLT